MNILLVSAAARSCRLLLGSVLFCTASVLAQTVPSTAAPAGQDTVVSATKALPSATKLPIGPAISERVCSLPRPGERQCHAHRLRQRPAEMALASGVVTGPAPSGFGPADLQSAYNLASFSASRGAGVTVAIVDAQDDPNAEADLAVYRSTFGLPACTTSNGCFKKVNQYGNVSPLPGMDTGWAGEISLDLDMVSAACPLCKILLVEANTANDADLDQAENTAAQMGARAISNSYGGDESSTDPAECNTAYNHPGIAITASSGDDGYGVESPASCGTVIAVGGTSLSRASGTARGWTEKVWSSEGGPGTGSGCSAYEVKPEWQRDAACTRRTVADVSAVSDPATGVAVYNTYGDGGWEVYGGTSAASPLVAGIYGLANASALSLPAQYAYTSPTFFNDVTSGSNGSCSGSELCTAEPGYDGPTGLGTPNGIGGFGPDTIAWATPAAVPYGTALSQTQLDATAPMAGTFAYWPAAGTVPPAGAQTLTAFFALPDSSYSQFATVSLNVSKATTTTAVNLFWPPAVGATVTPQISGSPSGTVTYYAGSTVLGTSPVNVPLALPSTNLSGLVWAVYNGDSNFFPSRGVLLEE